MTFDRAARIRAAQRLALLIVLVVIVEAASFFMLDFVALRDRGTAIRSGAMPAYRHVPWAAEYWREQRTQEMHGYEIHSYGLVRAKPFAGATIMVDSAGVRRTAHSQCDKDAPTVYVFGGSTVWGYGSADWETIPSHLAKRYAGDGRPACVLNFGSDAWRVDHGIIKLVQELKRPGARRPDVVVFLNGSNDVFTPFFVTGRVDREWEFFDSRGWLEEVNRKRGGSLRYLYSTNTSILAQRLLRRFDEPKIRHLPADAGRLASEIAQNYLVNIKIVEGLSLVHGFRFAFFWQPMSITGRKPLTAEEREGTDQGFGNAFPDARAALEITLPRVRAAADGRLHDLTNMFDAYTGSVYVDFCHLLPAGNSLVADRIYEVIR